MKRLNLQIFRNWEVFVIVGLPLILLPLLFIEDNEVIGTGDDARPSTKFKCAFVLLLMSVYWMVEAMPLAITALLPIVLFPLLGVQDTAKVSLNYMKETNMMFVGGLIIALAVEYCNLHRRIALNVMTTVGCSPVRLLFGVMLTTMFLSMWMSNVATAAMVVPIAMATLDELYPKPEVVGRRRRPSMFKDRSEVDFEAFLAAKKRAQKGRQEQLQKAGYPPLPVRNEPEPNEGTRFISNLDFEMQQQENDQKKRVEMKKMLLFSICMSANIGGTGVLTGTASNLVFQELIKPVNVGQDGKYAEVTFASWMMYNIPTMLINVSMCFLYLMIVFGVVPEKMKFWKRNKRETDDEETQKMLRVQSILEEKRCALGKMTFHELAVFILFIGIVLLWLFRQPKFITGWADYVVGAEVGDSTAAMIIVILLFVIPRNLETFFGYGEGGVAGPVKTPPLLDWKYIQLNLPWGVIILMGGGFALSHGVVYSGLSQWLGNQLHAVESMPEVVILIMVLCFAAGLTEVASNSACANVVIPILIALSESLDIHPLYLTLPVTVTCSYAFLLPVATPPNAIVFAAGGGDLTIMEMVKINLLPNILGIVVVFLSHLTFGNLMFDFNNYEYSPSQFIHNDTSAVVANATADNFMVIG